MEFSSEYWYSFHYSDSEGYLIFCCHDVASSVIYSLIETAKENGLDPYRYLLWLLQNAPGLSETDEAWAEKLLPARARKNAICRKNR